MSRKKRGMEYARLGDAGLWVSRICLGAMTFGTDDKWTDWMLDEDESRALIKRSLGAWPVYRSRVGGRVNTLNNLGWMTRNRWLIYAESRSQTYP